MRTLNLKKEYYTPDGQRIKGFFKLNGKTIPIVEYETMEDSMTEEIDKAPIGTVFEHFGGLTKQFLFYNYHGVHSANVLNDALRKNAELSDSQKKVVSYMDSKMELTESPITVNREVSVKTLQNMGLDVHSVDDVSNIRGQYFIDKGYGSSSYAPYNIGQSYYTESSKPIHMRISVPAGTPAYLTSNKNEHELTLGRGLTYFIKDVREACRWDRSFKKIRTSIIVDVEIQ